MSWVHPPGSSVLPWCRGQTPLFGVTPSVWGDCAGYRHSVACIWRGLDNMVHPNSSQSDLSLVYTYVQVEMYMRGQVWNQGDSHLSFIHCHA